MNKKITWILFPVVLAAILMCVVLATVLLCPMGTNAYAAAQWIDVDDTSGQIRYFVGDSEAQWNAFDDAAARGGSYMYASVAGYVVNDANRPAIEFAFTGTQVRFYGAKRTDTESLNFYIDGEPVATVDTYDATANTVNVLLFESEELEWGQHTLRVEAADGSATAFMVVDGVSYCDGMQWEEKVMYDSADIQYSTQPQWHSFDGYYYTQMSDATEDSLPYAEYTFVGEYVRFWGFRRPDTTSLKVYIDGEEKAIVDTYSAVQSEAEVLFVSDKLSLDTHTIRIEGVIEPGNMYTLVYAFEVPKSEAVTFPVQTSASQGGSITASAQVPMGESFQVDFTPDEGYSLLRVLVDGVVQPTAKQSYTFQNVSSAHTVEAVFQKEEVLWAESNRFGSQSEGLVYYPEPSSVSWNQYLQDGAFDGNIMYYQYPASAQEMPYCEFTFEGVKARFYGMLRADSYRLKVTVDGTTSYIVNTCEGTGFDVLFETDTLQQGTHTLKVEGVADDVASNQYLVIDSFQYAVALKDKAEIQQYYDVTVGKYDGAEYTEDSYAAFEAKMQALSQVLAKPDATLSELNAAYAEAIEAESGLLLFTHDIVVNVTGNGTVNEIPAVLNGKDSEILVLTPAAGYEVVSFKVDGAEVPLENLQYQFLNVTQSHRVDVVFAIITYSVTVETVGNGSVNVPDSVEYGQSLTIEISPAENNYIKSVTVNGVAYPAESEIVVGSIASDVAINVVFAEIAYDRQEVESLFAELKTINSAMYTQTSFDDFKFYLDILDKALQEEDTDIVELNTLLETTLQYKDKLTVRSLSVIVSATDGGSVTPSYEVLYGEDGDEIVFMADEGYEVERVTVNGKEVVVENNRLVLTNITSNQDVRVSFRKIRFVVTTQTEGNGLILVDSEVSYGEDLVVVIQAQEGNKIASVVIDGETVQLDDEYSTEIRLSSVKADVEISAFFEEIDDDAVTPATIGISVAILVVCVAVCIAIVLIVKKRNKR